MGFGRRWKWIFLCLTAVLGPACAWAVDPSAAASPSADFQLKISCRAHLSVLSLDPNEKGIDLAGESFSFSPTVSGFGHSTVRITFERFTLVAQLEMKGASADQLEPAFSMLLSQGSDPIRGQTNYVEASGLDLAARSAEAPLSLKGMNFLSFKYQNKNVGRVDYECSLLKIR